jgi:hypothetical protein
MRTISKTIRPMLAAAAAVLTLGVAASADAGNVVLPTPTKTLYVGRPAPLPCMPVGDEFKSVRITNTTAQVLPAGRKVSYKTSNGFEGSFTLASAVSPKGMYLGPKFEPFNTCTASVMVAQ